MDERIFKYFDYERLIPLIKKDNEKIDYSEIKKDKTINNKIKERIEFKINAIFWKKGKKILK